jgi:uncharacterized protein (DUF433 family)
MENAMREEANVTMSESPETKQESWIDIDPRVMGGAPCLRDTRVTVRNLAMLIDLEYEIPALLEAYPYLTDEDLFYANTYWIETLSKVGTLQPDETMADGDVSASGEGTTGGAS